MSFFGDSGGSRTHNLLLRTELLYPIELPSRASGRIALAQILIASEFWKAIAYQALWMVISAGVEPALTG